jgi:hypothetical protein
MVRGWGSWGRVAVTRGPVPVCELSTAFKTLAVPNADPVTDPPFGLGQTVRLRVYTSRVGAVLSSTICADGTWRFLVFHRPGDAREYDADQIEPTDRPTGGDTLLNALAAGTFVPPAEYRARITAARLAHPVVDNLYSMRQVRERSHHLRVPRNRQEIGRCSGSGGAPVDPPMPGRMSGGNAAEFPAASLCELWGRQAGHRLDGSRVRRETWACSRS